MRAHTRPTDGGEADGALALCTMECVQRVAGYHANHTSECSYTFTTDTACV
jgi:hypothetical protein